MDIKNANPEILKEVSRARKSLRFLKRMAKYDLNCGVKFGIVAVGEQLSVHLYPLGYDAVLNTLRNYARQGFRIKARRTSCDNTDFIYVLENKVGDKIELWFPISASKSCKKVKVGEKIEPVYEIVCE